MLYPENLLPAGGGKGTAWKEASDKIRQALYKM